MKKTSLLFFLLAISVEASNAQQTINPYSSRTSENILNPANSGSAPTKALGAQIWSDDFNDASNWTLDNDGQAGGAFGWSIDASISGWYFGSFNSTSGGGFAELSNGNPTAAVPSQVLDVVYTMTSISLDIPNLPSNAGNTDQVTLQFEEFGALYNDLQQVQISTDGLSWTTIRENSRIAPLNTAAAEYPNVRLVSINLAPYITGDASTVKIRFVWTTNYASLSADPNVWVTYGWYIDDLKIFTNPDNDVAAINSFWGSGSFNYSMIPIAQIAPIDFTTVAFNNGLNSQSNVELNVDVNIGAWTGVSQSADLFVGASENLIIATQYTPAAVVGSHSFTWEITQDEIDDVPSNNVIQGNSFDVTEYIYAHDNDVIDGSVSNFGEAYETGNFFTIVADQTAYAVDVKLHANTELGALVYAKIYAWDGTQVLFADALTFEQQSYVHTVTASDLGNVLSLPLLLPTNLTASQSTYFVVVCTDGDGGSSEDVVVATAGTSPFGTSYLYTSGDATWYTQTETPIVRLNFDNSTAELNASDANIAAVNVFPNPAAELINVSFNVMNSSDITIEVMDLNGSVVETISKESSTQGFHHLTINTSNYAAGVYYVNISTAEDNVKSKFVKK